MQSSIGAPILSAVLLGTLGSVQAAAAADQCWLVEVDRVGPAHLAWARRAEGVEWWMELGPWLVACGTADAAGDVGRELGVAPLVGVRGPTDLLLVRGFRPEELTRLDVEVVARGGQWTLVRGSADARLEAAAALEPSRRAVLPARRGVVVRQAANDADARSAARAPDPWVQGYLDEVDPGRWLADVQTLAGWDRWTYGSEIVEARDWLAAQLEGMPGLVVETPSFWFSGALASNVVATLTGTWSPDEWVVIGGHYDAVSGSPGADDNASGCAGVLELARVLSADPPGPTFVFACYAGEEQGLYGSEDHAGDLVASGNDDKVVAMVDMDMIGYTGDSLFDCDLESWPSYAWLLDGFAAAALTYTTLDPSLSTSPCCSDHMSYLSNGMPALMTIESGSDFNPYYHQPSDVPGNLTAEYAGEILRMNLAAVLELVAGDVVFRDGFEWGDLSSWTTGP